MTTGSRVYVTIPQFVIGGLALSLISLAPAAQAQSAFDRSANVGVLDRPHPEYEALGLPLGSWLVYPKVTLESDYDDNIYATQANAAGDAIFSVKPEVVVQSNWTENSVSLSAGSTIDRYVSHPSEDTTPYYALFTASHFLQNDYNISLTAKYSDNYIPRTSATYIQNTKNPLQYNESNAQLNAFKEFNFLKISGGFSVTNDNYYSGILVGGGPFTDNYLDRTTYSGSLRADYAVSPDFAVFVEEILSSSQYADSPSRNYSGTQTLVGVNFQVTHLIAGEVGFGYLTSNYADPTYHNVGVPSGRAQLKWYPTQLLTVTLSASEGFFDSGLPSTPTYLAQNILLQADYELLRNVIITGRLGSGWDEYRGIDRSDNQYNGGISINYLLNRAMGIGLRFSHQSQYSFGLNRGVNFNDDRVGLALTLQR